MPDVLVPLAQGCEELEAVTIINLLRRADIEVVTAGLTKGAVTASRGTVLVPDTTLDTLTDRDFTMIVLPGGLPGADYLEADTRLREMLLKQHRDGRWLAAICAAPKILASAGVLDGKRATSYPGVLAAADYPQIELIDAPVVVDGRVVTSRGPGTAMDFALQLIELLVDAALREKVERALVRPS